MSKVKLQASRPEQIVLAMMAPAWSDKEPLATRGFFEALHSLWFAESRLSRQKRFATGVSGYAAEIVANRGDGIRFLWVIPKTHEHAVRRLLESYCPDFKIFKTEDHQWPKDNYSRLINFKLSHDFKESLKAPDDLKDYDPLGYLTASLVKLKEGEQICYQLLSQPVKSAGSYWLNAEGGTLPIKVLKGAIGLTGKAAGACLNIFNLEAAENKAMATQTIEEPLKTQTPLFKTSLKIFISSPCKVRIKEHTQTLTAALSLFSNPGLQSLDIENKKQDKSMHTFFERQFAARQKGLYLSPAELAGLYHFPNSKSSSFEAMPRFLSKTLPPTPRMLAETNHHVLLGENHHQDQVTPIGLSEEERKRHVYIVGGTGTGKTTLLKYQIVQDIKQGRGVAVIDPHGDLAADLLNYIPKKRINDVIYFNPADYKYPIGINLLQLPKGLEGDKLEHARDIRTEAMVSVLRKVFHSDSEDIGHRIEYVLRNTIQTAFTVMEPTLFTIFKLLNDRLYNQQIIRALKDPYLKMFWRNEIGRAGAMQKVKMQAGVTSKIGRFIFSTSIKKTFNQVSEDCLDFDALINKKRILICNFSKGLIGEDASQLFSTTVLAKIQLTILEQVAKKPERRKQFYLYVDEFQHFATQSFVEMLSEARKYGLNLIMAQQSTQQQGNSRLTEILLANVGTTIIFRTGSPADTNLLIPLFDPFLLESDLTNMSAYNFYMRSSAINTLPIVSGLTKLLDPPSGSGITAAIIKASRKNFACRSGGLKNA